MHVWKLTDPIYFATVHVLHGTAEDAKRWQKRRWGGTSARFDIPCSARTTTYERRDGVQEHLIWLPETWRTDVAGICTLLHETLHVTFEVLMARGLKVADGSEEAFTYYQEMLFRDALTRLDRRQGHAEVRHLSRQSRGVAVARSRRKQPRHR